MTALGLLILRLVVGLILAAHGAQKLIGWWGGPGIAGWIGAMNRMRIRPAFAWGWMSALSELLGGLAVAAGFLSPLGNLAIAAAMRVAVALVPWPKGFWNTKGGVEFNLLIIGVVAALAITGSGALSLDAAIGIHFPEPLTLVAGTIAMLAGVGVVLGTRSPAEARTRETA